MAAAALAAAAIPSFSQAQTAPQPVPVLDVPYLPQSEALCGAAAIAMVMRYWGVTGVYAETFADLVDGDANGIRGSDLIRALEQRGFEATSFEGDSGRIQSALATRDPLVALIEDRPGRLHYVVIVGWRGNRVVLHDPARAPYRVVTEDAFLRAWAVSRFWTLLARPEAAVPIPPPPVDMKPAASRSSGVCAGMVEEGIRLAGTGDLTAAQHVLDLAAADCDGDAAPLRELAGVHAVRGDWSSAARDARRALERDPNDQHAVRTLATSLFLEGKDEEALDAWNRIGAPVVEIIDIRGLERTRFAVAASALGVETQTLLTRRGLARARRRLAALPSLMGSRVAYEPGEDDRANVTVAALERQLVPSGLVQVVALGLRAATDGALAVGIASPTGGGELWTASWRWWERRPRVAIGVAAPSPFGGVWSIDAFAERQAYGTPGFHTSERRRGVTLKGSDWITATSSIQAGVSLDRWADGIMASLIGGFAQVFASGQATATLDTVLMTGPYRAAVIDAGAEWRSTERRQGSTWQAWGGSTVAGSGAPLAFWPGAGTGQGRDVLLRAHPLVDDGSIRGVFGRRLTHASAEWRYWRGPVLRALHVAPAVFVDAARASGVPEFGDGRTHVDMGVGVRVAIPGAGVVRVDLGKGLRDGETALSFGWMR